MASARTSAPARSGRSWEERYARLAASLDPNAPKEVMEARIAEEFGDDPAFEQAYKESVKLDGEWYDLVGAYGAPNANWHGLMLKRASRPSSRGMSSMSSLGFGYESYDPGYAAIRTPASQGMPARARPPIAPLPNVSRAAYVPLAAPAMASLGFPEAA